MVICCVVRSTRISLTMLIMCCPPQLNTSWICLLTCVCHRGYYQLIWLSMMVDSLAVFLHLFTRSCKCSGAKVFPASPTYHQLFESPTQHIFSIVPSLWTTRQQTVSKVVIYFSLTHFLEERKHSDAGRLMFMFCTCQSGGELSGSGSVNWALIRCCSN